MTKGLLHSIQTLGAVDGPGLRTVISLQGCPLKCKFCHSIDTTLTDRGEEVSTQDLVNRVLKNRPYWKRYLPNKQKADTSDPRVMGGVTITGGDPVAQPVFVTELLREFQDLNVHTVLETSLFTSRSVIDMFYENVDLWMISLKHMDPGKHEDLTGRPSNTIFENLKYLDQRLTSEKRARRIRIRYVVIPGLTDSESDVKMLGTYVKKIKALEHLELLPYVTLGKYKWIELYGEYPLEGIPDAGDEVMNSVYNCLEELDLPILNLVK